VHEEGKEERGEVDRFCRKRTVDMPTGALQVLAHPPKGAHYSGRCAARAGPGQPPSQTATLPVVFKRNKGKLMFRDILFSAGVFCDSSIV
jgi:hypothetical protein